MTTKLLPWQYRGMALIAVLWLVAAMGLIMSGVVQSVRKEARTTGMQRQIAVAKAHADAAVLLALNKIQVMPPDARSIVQSIPVQFQDMAVTVRVQPLNSLIDLNSASQAMFLDLYRYVIGLEPAVAASLAQATVNTRDAKNSKNAVRGFASVEDLLAVPGMIYDHYAKIKNLLTVDIRSGNGRIYPVTASFGVLLVLTGGDGARAAALIAQRKNNPNLMDTSFLKPDLIEMTSSSAIQLQVDADMPDGSMLQRTWIVNRVEDTRTGLPWRVLGTSHAIAHPTGTFR